MKCRSVACLWSGAPPSHRVSATAVLNQPPTLYTGGSDGSIIWWNLSFIDSESEIKPIALMCGHAAAIADLCICLPMGNSMDGVSLNSSDLAMNSLDENYAALVSACIDGVLCVWSRSSGHCRRRRKLPPWAGSPSIIHSLPSRPRYVCIGCSSIHADPHSVDFVEGGDVLGDRDTPRGRPSSCTVVVVDTYSLTIVQTVFHGNLSVGPMKFMSVVQLGEYNEKHYVLITDTFGRSHTIPISSDLNPGNESHKDSTQVETNTLENVCQGHIISVVACGNLVAFLSTHCCIFWQLVSNSKVGEIVFDDCICSYGDSPIRSHAIGAMFLESGCGEILASQEAREMFLKFVIWNNRGSAVMYAISSGVNMFNFEPLCKVPAVSYSLDLRLSIQFIQLNHLLIRIESICLHIEKPAQWKPHVTIWSLCQKNDEHKSSPTCKKLRQSEPFDDCISSISCPQEIHESNFFKTRTTNECAPTSSSNDIGGMCDNDNATRGFVKKGKLVSSSMVISENLFAPYAIVYGFFSGEIEVVHFDLLPRPASHGETPRDTVGSLLARQNLSGHEGAVLCLAAHQMLGKAEGWSFHQVLVSGSMDCTIRIWDLETGGIITVMHQHVAPVRQIIFPPVWANRPWSDCFLSVGDDLCVSLASLETLRVERMFPGHLNYPAKVVWDGGRSYIACLCPSHSGPSDAGDLLYIWDVKTGARERILRGTASHSMFDQFCKRINRKSSSGSVLNGNTSVSSLVLPVIEEESFTHSQLNQVEKSVSSSNTGSSRSKITLPSSTPGYSEKGNFIKPFPTKAFGTQNLWNPIICSCPFPGVAALSFDLAALMCSIENHDYIGSGSAKHNMKDPGSETSSADQQTMDDTSDDHGTLKVTDIEEHDKSTSLVECLLRFSLSFLHLWGVDVDLDELLLTDMKLKIPENFTVASGLQGDKGSFTLTFPSSCAILELWKSSSEFSAMRSLTMVSLAQRIVSLSHSCSASSSALSAFYTRGFAEKFSDIKSPLLQLLVSFWQDESEHVRMAARSLFHCAASRTIPHPLCCQKATGHAKFLRSLSGIEENKISGIEGTSMDELDSERILETKNILQDEESKILAWLESFEMQDWISCVGGTSQDAMTSHIIVAAALTIWYPSLVKPSLPKLVVHSLIKLVMAMNEKYSSTAAELLAEGMESAWKACIGSEIPRLMGDIFFQIECVSDASVSLAEQYRETLVGVLLPSLAMADIGAFLTVIESQIWSTASDSPVHLVSLMALVRVVRTSPRCLVQHLDKVVNFILQTIDPGNSVMRKTCFQSSMTTLREVVRIFPMVALNDASTRLALGDPIGEINNTSIRVYDMQSVMKIKVLDASGPSGLPILLSSTLESGVTTAISALSFSPDGEGLIAFSEHGLMIRWWSLGSVWWEKLTRNLAPVHCTKLIFVPPWEGFSPNTSRSSIMTSIMGQKTHPNMQENVGGGTSCADSLKLSTCNIDLSYQLEWVGDRKVQLTRHGLEIGSFQL